MPDIKLGYIVAIIISLALIGTMFAAYKRWISPVLAGGIMVLVSYGVAAITMWGDDIGVMCVGLLLAISFGPVTLGAAIAVRKIGEKTQESKRTGD